MAETFHRCGRDCEVTREQIMSLKKKYRSQPLTPMGYPPAHMTSGKTPPKANIDRNEKERRQRDRELTEANRRVKVLGPDMKIHWFWKRDWDERGRDLLAK